MDPLEVVLVDLEAREAADELLEADATLEPGQRGADAEVGPVAEGQVPVEVAPALALTLPIVTGPVSAQAMLPPVNCTVSKLLAAFVSVMFPRVPAVPPRSVTVRFWPTFNVTGALWVRL